MNTELFFDQSELPKPKGEYVLWCDGMGTGQELHRNLDRSAAFVFKLHSAFLKASNNYEGFNFYPVMDGLYITTDNRINIENLISEAFFLLAKEFVSFSASKNMFMVRGGIAFGPVIHGHDIPDSAFGSAPISPHIKNSILLSPAMVAANKVESKAPPFGVYIDDSAKSTPVLCNPADNGFISSLFQWWIRTRHNEKKQLLPDLYEKIMHYLEKAETHNVGLNYPIDRIKFHRDLVEEYLGGYAP